MTDLRQAAQQALEALENSSPDQYPEDAGVFYDAKDALRTALEPPQQQAEPPEWLLIKNILDEYGLQAIDFVAEWKAAQQQAEPVAWDKPSASFNGWWDSYHHDPANPFAEGLAAYWAWAGWKAAQRQWVGLTDEDVNRESAMIAQKMKLAFHAGMYVAQQILKEKNNDSGY